MINPPDPNSSRSNSEEKSRRNAANRATRLNPTRVAEFTSLVTDVARTVGAGERPCSYAPWQAALNDHSRVHPNIGNLPDEYHPLPTNLMSFAADVAQPAWPEPRTDLIEFALAFLEADVMLFRSGYAKQHLIKRLQQSDLSKNQTSRVETLLRRAITQGTGPQEFRAFCKLAAHLHSRGQLPEFDKWLKDQSEGAILTLDRAKGDLASKIMASAELSEQDRNRALSSSFFGRSKWGIIYPNLTEVVPAGQLHNEPSQQIKYSAYLMLEAIQKRETSKRKPEPL